MSDVKRWLAVPGPGSYVRLMPVGDEASGVDIFAKSNELHALAAQLAAAERDAARWVWLIVNGERCFGTLWREATIGDIDAAMAPRSGVEGEQP